MTFYVKQNDTSPAMLATLQDANGTAVSLVGATVRFHMRQIGRSDVVVDAPAIIVTPLEGLVRYDWIAADTNIIGSYQAEFEVTYADASVETFPNDSYIAVEIIDDIA
jgi:hypothetical protein